MSAVVALAEPSGGLLDLLADEIADRVCERLADRAPNESAPDGWMETRTAAEYAGMHRDTLSRLAREGRVSSAQDGPGCKRFYRRSDLDALRMAGPSSPASMLLPRSIEAA